MTAITAKYTDNLPEYIRQLRAAGVALQYAGAAAINKGAEAVKLRYERALQTKVRLRAPNFTLKSIRLYQAHATRSDGTTLRAMSKINAVVGVPMMRGGKEHYLGIMETGETRRGSSKTGGRVPIPLDMARSGMRNRPVVSRFRLEKEKPTPVTIPQKIAGNPRQIYAYLHNLQQRGKLAGRTVQTPDGIYSVKGKRASKVSRIRSAKKRALLVKKKPLFSQAVDGLGPEAMDRFFTWAAREELRKRGLL